MSDQENSPLSSSDGPGNDTSIDCHESQGLEQVTSDKEQEQEHTQEQHNYVTTNGNDDNDIDIDTDTADNNNDDGLVWYFSYGSNMNPQVFEEKRKIKPLDHMVCYVPGYVLTYTEGILPYLEPAFCTCVPRERLPALESGRPRPTIHGVAFRITRDQYEHVLLTEGGFGYQDYDAHPFWTINHYGVLDVDCIEIDPVSDGDDDEDITNNNNKRQLRTVRAKTLVGLLGARQRYDCNASKRYYNLVTEGAKSSGLPRFYLDYLRDEHPPYADPTHDSAADTDAVNDADAVGVAKTSKGSAGWGVPIAKILYIVVYIPCIFFMSGLQYYFRRNERRLLALQPDAKPSSEPPVPRGAGAGGATTPTPTPRITQHHHERIPFQDVVRPPWIVLKACSLYDTYVMKMALQTILFDWCKIPCGFHNQHKKGALGDGGPEAAATTTTPSAIKTKHE